MDLLAKHLDPVSWLVRVLLGLPPHTYAMPVAADILTGA
jgi:hypothetical protein